MRTGLLAKKLGMTRLYLEDRKHSPVTVLKLENCQVVGHRKKEIDGYDALLLGFGEANMKKLKKPQSQFYAKLKIEAKNKVREFRVSEKNFVEVGKTILASHFVVGQFVDVSAKSIGKGFAGAMKRHNFGGLRASHGVSISHRSHGSTGNSQDPGRVWKGKKMAGQMGNTKVTKQNLEVLSIDEDRGLILVKGGVPGSKGAWVYMTDAEKKSLPANAPFPAGIANDENRKLNENNVEENNISTGTKKELVNKVDEKNKDIIVDTNKDNKDNKKEDEGNENKS